MTFDEFLEKCREKDGWELVEWGGRRILRLQGDFHNCPLSVVFGLRYVTQAKYAGLYPSSIIAAADGHTNGPYRKALETLVLR